MTHYVMRSVAGSVRTHTCDIFSFLLDWSAHLERYILLKTPLESVQWFQMSNWRVLRTIENNRNSFLFLATSHNQCCRLPTDPARSQHIYLIWQQMISAVDRSYYSITKDYLLLTDSNRVMKYTWDIYLPNNFNRFKH